MIKYMSFHKKNKNHSGTPVFFYVRIVFILLFMLGSVLTNAQGNSNPEALKTYPILWQQHAAEYRALCYQAFNIAQLRLNEIPTKKFRKEKLAIITDLDETILDNSYQEAQLIKDKKPYTFESWKQWVGKSAATAVPGAVEFLQAAKKKGVAIFYISNRDTGDLGATLVNLQKLNLPDADSAHALFLTNTSSKEVRRQIVMTQYNVIMLMGDNLN
ncbi:MAG TPA: HAD family acid phosphatase, partial [Chitinophagaceae bacterium]